MNLSFYIARRLSFSSSGRRSSPAVKVAAIAVGLSVAVMIASLAIVGGFKREIVNKIIGLNAHITLMVSNDDGGGDNLVNLNPSLKRILDSQPYITAYWLEAAIPAVLKTPDNFKGVYLKGFGHRADNAFLQHGLAAGELPDYAVSDNHLKAVITSTIANELHLKPGDTVETYFLSDDVRLRKLTVGAITDSHFESYDKLYIYGDLGLVADLGGFPDSKGTMMRILTEDFDSTPRYAAELNSLFAKEYANGRIDKLYHVDTTLERGEIYFSWLRLLDTNVIVILVLMSIVACVTLISGMLIIILDKVSLIGILKAMGAPGATIRRIFIWLALKVCLIGLGAGNVIMIVLLWIQERTHLLRLDPEAYYIDFVPVRIDWLEVGILNVAVLLLIWLALILPSHIISTISPATTIRYE